LGAIILCVNLISFYIFIAVAVLGQSQSDSSGSACQEPSMSDAHKVRALKKILPNQGKHWVGNGFHVQPVFGKYAFTNTLSPFLMFDYAEPKYFEPTNRRLGVGEHPHRGFETVTIAFQGEVEHGDSMGNTGVIGTGDVQWMTAASGVIHKEFHSTSFAKSGGMFEMCQLWVNLPAKNKMDPPRYQAITDSTIPKVETEFGWVRLVSGEFNDSKGPAMTFSPVIIWDMQINEGQTATFPTENNHNVIVFVRDGQLENIDDRQLGLFGPGTELQLKAKKDSKVLLLAGEPLDEPIAHRGPFAMNTDAEIRQAMRDFQTGNFIKH